MLTGMHLIERVRTPLAALAGAGLAISLHASEPTQSRQKPEQPAGPGVMLTVHTPEPRRLLLALDELDLDVPSTREGAAPRLLPSTALTSRSGNLSTLRVNGAATRQDLASVTKALESANPGAEVRWVLYDPERPRTPATRVLLTREIGLIVDDNVSPESLLADAGKLRSVPGIPNAYVLEASDPDAALVLTERLRDRSGIKTAYSLLKRQMFAR
jgi:hypothetical protein